MAPRPTKKSPGSTTPQPPPRPDLPVQARHPPPPGLPATAPRPTAVVGRVVELMGGKLPDPVQLAGERLPLSSVHDVRGRDPTRAVQEPEAAEQRLALDPPVRHPQPEH